MKINLLSEKVGRITSIEQLLEASDMSLEDRENNLGHTGRSHIEGQIFDKLKGKIADMYA